MLIPDDPTDLPPADAAALDAPLDPALRAAARAYNVAPPDVPADAMWAAIQARRAQRAPRAPQAAPADVAAPPPVHVARGTTHDIAHHRGRGLRAHPATRWAPRAAAAALLLATGIGVGRLTASRGDGAPTAVATADGGATPVRAPDGAVAPPAVGGAADGPRPDRAAPLAPAAPAAPRTLAEARRAPRGAVPDAPDAVAPRAGVDPDGSAPLRVATAQHLAHAEALLTTFVAHRADAAPTAGGAASARASSDAEAAWARDLLVTTRLLLDSPAGRDPSRRALLEDLELLLAQIARLPRADTPEERALIDGAIRRGDVMAKLRGAQPDERPTAAAPAPTRGT
jgi:hypothetical protein